LLYRINKEQGYCSTLILKLHLISAYDHMAVRSTMNFVPKVFKLMT